MPRLTNEEITDFLENILTQTERDAIAVALESENPWSHNDFEATTRSNLESAKIKIKVFHAARVGQKCCYCGRSLVDATIESDREHVIPKRKAKTLSYDLFNLSIACKRCNMTYKGEKTDHIVDFKSIETDFRNPSRYLIPHPNIDIYEDHLNRCTLQFDGKELTTYKCLTNKGKFLFDFVKLDRLCVNQFDVAQGGKPVNEEIERVFQQLRDGI
ncbi:MAG TPA: hypothetical protein DIS96_05860 [Pusillimonas sp.]|nr:hypothetical protein [Pusillimonas sp.]